MSVVAFPGDQFFPQARERRLGDVEILGNIFKWNYTVYLSYRCPLDRPVAVKKKVDKALFRRLVVEDCIAFLKSIELVNHQVMHPEHHIVVLGEEPF